MEASDRMRGEIFERLDKDKNGVLAKGEWERVYSEAKVRERVAGESEGLRRQIGDGERERRGAQALGARETSGGGATER